MRQRIAETQRARLCRRRFEVNENSHFGSVRQTFSIGNSYDFILAVANVRMTFAAL